MKACITENKTLGIPKSEIFLNTIKNEINNKYDPSICSDYKPLPPYNQYLVSYKDIILDWKKMGGSKEDCPAALIVASGETSCDEKGCVIPAQNGIWQTDPIITTSTNNQCNMMTNICCNVNAIKPHLYVEKSYEDTCFDPFNSSFTGVPLVVPNDHIGQGLHGTQSNWIGPFCHTGALTCANDENCNSQLQSTPSGDIWGGGQLSNQLFPFPYYYYSKLLSAFDDKCKVNGNLSDTCYCESYFEKNKTITESNINEANKCLEEKIVNPSISIATYLCKTFYD